MVAQQVQLPVRNVVHRTHGLTGGPITRLMSPSDLGHAIKPFVFLDLAVVEDGEDRTPMEVLWHPHSGIAMVTVILEGSIRFAETTGRTGVLPSARVDEERAPGTTSARGTSPPGSPNCPRQRR
jgi:redox-sensitive bicupin YhaK (pirin superfamily)